MTLVRFATLRESGLKQTNDHRCCWSCGCEVGPGDFLFGLEEAILTIGSTSKVRPCRDCLGAAQQFIGRYLGTDAKSQ